MKFTEKQINSMASPISQSEGEKCKNAIRMVRDAMKKLDYTDDGKEIRSYMADTYSYTLNQQYTGKKITLLVQVSYANRTNIPMESDVDVAVILESTFISKYRNGVSGSDYGFSEGTFSVSKLKDEVQKALNQHFGWKGIERHDKCIKVVGNTYRVDADVVPAYRYRDYSDDYQYDDSNYVGGIAIKPDSGGKIINYPERHIRLGIAKNKVTKYNFKKCVRIIKSMRERMEENGYRVNSKVSSFGLESLLWNVDVSAYTKYSSILRYTFGEIVSFLKNDFVNFGTYVEINGIKSLFPDLVTQNAYKDFINYLYNFYEYDIQE